MDLLELEQRLQQTYLFGWLDPERLRALEGHLSVHRFHPGDAVVRRGEPAEGWHLVYAGRARSVVDRARRGALPYVVATGDAIGTRGLVDRCTWPATMRAESALTLLTLPRSAFEAFASTLAASDRAQLLDRIAREADFAFLRRLRIFAGWPIDRLDALLSSVTAVARARGAYLFHEDDAADSFYIVRSGRLQLLKNVDASQKYLGTRRDGDLVGEIELVYGTPRMAHALAATDVELFEVRRSVFDELIPGGDTRQAVFQLATERLLQYQNLLSELDQRSADDRLPALTLTWTKAGSGPFARAYPFVAAASPLSAGLACLAMIDGFRRRESVWQEHLEQLLWDRQADTLLTLGRKAEDCGYVTQLAVIDPTAIESIALPAVIEDDDGSPAVAFRARSGRIAIANPLRGLRTVDPALLAATWNGRVLAIDEAPRPVLPWLLRAYAPYLVGAAAAALLVQAFALGPPLATKLIIDRVLVHADRSMFRLLLAGLAGLMVFRALAGLVREHLLAHTIRRIGLLLQVRFLDHVLRLPYAAGRHVGDLAACFRENGRLVEFAYRAGLPLVVDTLSLILCFAVLVALSRPLAIVAFGFVAAYGAVALLLTPFVQRIAGRTAHARQAVGRHLIETVSNIQTIKALATEPIFLASGTRLLTRLRAQEFAVTSMLANREIVGGVLHLAATAALLGYGATLTLAGAATTGGMVAALGVLGATLVPLNRLLEARTAVREARASAATIGAVLGLAREESVAAVAPAINGHLELKQVSFRYPGTAEDVLSAVNLEILPGQRVAFVGRSGSGKTTLVNLLMGLYRPTGGTIHLDDIDLSSLPKSALRRQIGIVEQHPFLFEGSVADNIAKADPSVPLDRIVAAATHAGAHEFISALPQGYRTPIGERGARLSGGEKQRLMIARALVDDPRILILDEATSALDSGSERALYRRIEEACPGRTVIMIAHRIGAVLGADLIVVLDRGRVVETGAHAELMARRGLYYYLNTRAV